MKGKFLRFQMELIGTKEEDLTEKLVNRLNRDYEQRKGIYSRDFGDIVQIGKHSENGSLVLCGCITAVNTRICRGVYSALKDTAKSTFPTCKKTTDMLVATGDKLF